MFNFIYLFFWLCHGICAMSQTCALAVEAWSPNHCAAREPPQKTFNLKAKQKSPGPALAAI